MIVNIVYSSLDANAKVIKDRQLEGAFSMIVKPRMSDGPSSEALAAAAAGPGVKLDGCIAIIICARILSRVIWTLFRVSWRGLVARPHRLRPICRC